MSNLRRSQSKPGRSPLTDAVVGQRYILYYQYTTMYNAKEIDFAKYRSLVRSITRSTREQSGWENRYQRDIHNQYTSTFEEFKSDFPNGIK